MNVIVYAEQTQNGIVRLSLIDIETEKELPEAVVKVPLKEIYKAKVDLVSFWRGRLIQEVERVRLNQPRPLEVLCVDRTLIPVVFETNGVRQVYRLVSPVKTLCCAALFLSGTRVELLDKLEDNKATILVGDCKHIVNVEHLAYNSTCVGVSG